VINQRWHFALFDCKVPKGITKLSEHDIMALPQLPRQLNISLFIAI